MTHLDPDRLADRALALQPVGVPCDHRIDVAGTDLA